MKKARRVAVIGGGISGIGCAHALQDADVEVRLFERGDGLGGRCATRLWQGHLVDLGVQYFTAQSPDFKKELLTRLRQFRPIVAPVLDENEKLVLSPSGPRFYVLQGNNYLAHVLARGLDVALNRTVDSVKFEAGGVRILGEKFDAVVSALPGPATARLLQLPAAPIEFEPVVVALLEYANDGQEPGRQCYGRLLADAGPLAASFCENHKSGRIVGNKTVFVVQASSAFSAAHADEAPEAYLPALRQENERRWHLPPGLYRAGFVHVWRQGRPIVKTRRRTVFPPGAFGCGDSRCASNVEDVWLDGRKAAAEVLAHFDR